MKIYVWRGERVLPDYSSGLVVVAARDADEAWRKLKKADFNAWAHLTYGIGGIYFECELDLDYDCIPEGWIAVQPEEYTLETLPVLVKEGGG